MLHLFRRKQLKKEKLRDAKQLLEFNLAFGYLIKFNNDATGILER